MCGIAGIVHQNPEKPVSREILERMTRKLIHRGPDEEGYHIAQGVGLGHRRLSIIDLSTGRQPISNEDGTIWTIFNGEIYNFQELRARLEGKHRFQTRSDTEVIVHLYEEEGENWLSHLEGMFSLALWDGKRKRLILARDRMGKKPLYYAALPDKIIFASEIKALLEHPDVPREMDLVALDQYLLYEYIPCPRSIFKAIKKIPPAHALLWENGKIKIWRYWDFPDEEIPIREEEACEKLESLLRQAVKKRLVSDVPLGVFLSGGIDSSAVTAFMAEEASGRIKTFNVSFEEASFDESASARLVARRFGTEHHEERLSISRALELIEKVPEFLDEPMADSSFLPTYLLSQFTRKHVTVALGGDGGDELLGGYPTNLAHFAHRFWRPLPEAVKSVIRFGVAHFPISGRYFSLEFKARRFLLGADFLLGERHIRWMGAFQPEDRNWLYTPQMKQALVEADPFEPLRRNEEAEISDELSRAMRLDARTYMTDDILVKVDRASMANSLEVRAPFLDREFAEFALSLPSSLKFRRGRTKVLFKKAMKKHLPREILEKPKHGFSIPLAQWLRAELGQLVSRSFEEGRIKRQGIFEPKALQGLLSEHKDFKADHKKKLWALLVFQLWFDKYQ